ncbi:acyltransferase family protein [Nocardiopsis coralliicola]
MTPSAASAVQDASPPARRQSPERRRSVPGEGRDLFLDALRLFVIVLVVLQHWSLPVLAYEAGTGELRLDTVLSTDGGYIVTWFVQVMPLIFFVGGAVNVQSHRAAKARGGRSSEWIARRLRRLAWPVVPLTAAWIPASYLLDAVGVSDQPLSVATHAAGMVLWFLAVYVLVIVATPLLSIADLKYGWRVPVALLAGATAVDALRFGSGVDAVGYANIAFVWLAVHQFGFRYSAGAVGRIPAAAMAAGGFGTAVGLAALGPHSANMTGVFAVEASNVSPPTMVLAALGVGQIGIALLLRPWIAVWSGRPVPARFIGWAGPRLMAVYLWHMAPLVLIAAVLVAGVGMATPAPLSPMWGLWILAGAVLLVPLLWAVARWAVRLEVPPRRLSGDPGRVRALAAAGLMGGGLLLLTVAGLGTGPLPAVGAAAVAGGLAITLPLAPRAMPLGAAG